MSGHTPGPWRCANGETFEDHLYIEAVDNHVTADCFNECLSIAAMKANARLIAAAPEMFDALETIARGNTDPDQMVALAQAALDIAESAK